MEGLSTAVDDSLRFLVAASDYVFSYFLWAELWLRQQMIAAGTPPVVQTAVLICIGAIVAMASARFFGGLIRVAVVMLLVLTLARIAIPGAEP